ncbi:MAG TPA: hypothetical protein VF844_21245 [Ktedonobacteraceae bacterium]
MVIGGAVIYDAAEAEGILLAYARYAEAAPDELTTMVNFMAAPPAPFIPPEKQGAPVLVIMVCYTGDLAEGERVVAPLRALGTPIADVISPMPYPAMFAMTEEASILGRQHAVRSLFLRTLSDDAIHTIVREAAAVISPETLVQVRVLGGAMSRVPANATAFAHRDKQAMVMITSMAPVSAGAEPSRARSEQVWQALRPYADGVYVVFSLTRVSGEFMMPTLLQRMRGWRRSRSFTTRPTCSTSTRTSRPRELECLPRRDENACIALPHPGGGARQCREQHCFALTAWDSPSVAMVVANPFLIFSSSAKITYSSVKGLL